VAGVCAVNDYLLPACLAKFDALAAVVTGMDDATLNRRPPFPGGNSPHQLVGHCLGMARRWSSTVNLGVTVPRDRDAEFTSTGSVDELLRQVAATRAAFEADVVATDLGAPPTDPPPTGQPWLTSCGTVLVHVYEELCQHLGHLEVTRDLLAADA